MEKIQRIRFQKFLSNCYKYVNLLVTGKLVIAKNFIDDVDLRYPNIERLFLP